MLYGKIKQIDEVGASFCLPGVLNHDGQTHWLLEQLIKDGFSWKELKMDYNNVFEFLENQVRPFGEYRIHTSKKGIKLYLEFSNQKYTGWYPSFLRLYNNEGNFIHPQCYVTRENKYYESFLGKTLIECFQKHKDAFPGDFPVSSCKKYCEVMGCSEYQGDLDDFLKSLKEISFYSEVDENLFKTNKRL